MGGGEGIQFYFIVISYDFGVCFKNQVACKGTNYHKFKTISRLHDMSKINLVCDKHAHEDFFTIGSIINFWWLFKSFINVFLGDPVEYFIIFIYFRWSQDTFLTYSTILKSSFGQTKLCLQCCKISMLQNQVAHKTFEFHQ